MTRNRRLAAGLLTAAGLIAMLGGCTARRAGGRGRVLPRANPGDDGTAAPPPPPEEAVTDPGVTGVLCVNANPDGQRRTASSSCRWRGRPGTRRFR